VTEQEIECAKRVKLLERVLNDLLWSNGWNLSRCRNNAKIALGQGASPKDYDWEVIRNG